MSQINANNQEIDLINLNKSQNTSNLKFTLNQKTLVLDLLMFLKKNFNESKIDIYFNQKEQFDQNLNYYLFKQLQGSKVYYKVNYSQNQVQSEYIKKDQEYSLNQYQKQNTNFTPNDLKSKTMVDSEKQQQNNLCSIQNDEFRQKSAPETNIQELKTQFCQKEEELQKIYYEKEVELNIMRAQIQEKDNQIIVFKKENKELQTQIMHLRDFLSQQNSNSIQQIQNLNEQISQLKLKNQNQSNQIDQLLSQLSVIQQQKQQNSNLMKQQQIFQQGYYQPISDETNFEENQFFYNKCGHGVDEENLAQILRKSIMSKSIAKCQICNTNFSSQLCLENNTYGKEYLDMKFILELPELFKNIKSIESKFLTLVQCPSINCKFVCFWKQNGKSQLKDGFCPNCLMYSIKNPMDQLFFTNN